MIEMSVEKKREIYAGMTMEQKMYSVECGIEDQKRGMADSIDILIRQLALWDTEFTVLRVLAELEQLLQDGLQEYDECGETVGEVEIDRTVSKVIREAHENVERIYQRRKEEKK